ncbi:MAG: copper homeostasis protein CutC, partial [Clostridia bacterium]|nr:copper homeostasis protein CutC [Clostridia bacterium]
TLYPLTKAKAYHMSGKISLDSEMKYRKPDVNMGIQSMSEYEIWRTDENKIREARQVLEEL